MKRKSKKKAPKEDVVPEQTGLSDHELLDRVLSFEEKLTSRQLAAFEEMREGGRQLSDKQRLWIVQVLAIHDDTRPAQTANVFSSMSLEKQQEQRKKAARVQLPWEKTGYKKPAKPPGRG